MHVLLNCVGLLVESCLVPIAQAVEHWSCKPQVPGSIPGGDWHFFALYVLASLSSFKFINLPTLLDYYYYYYYHKKPHTHTLPHIHNHRSSRQRILLCEIHKLFNWHDWLTNDEPRTQEWRCFFFCFFLIITCPRCSPFWNAKNYYYHYYLTDIFIIIIKPSW